MTAPRIVSLVPSLTELVCALGRADWLVGRTGFCIHPAHELARIPKVGGTKTVNIERIRRLAPTHLIVNIDENEKPTVDALAAFIPNVIVTHPITVEDNFALYDRFGQLFDARARAADLCTQLERALDALTQHRFDRLPVVYLIWNDPWMTISADTFIAKMLACVGIDARTPAAASSAIRYPSLARESIPAMGVDALLLSSEPCRFRVADRALLRQAWTDQARQPVPVLGIDGEMTSWYGPRAIEGLRYLQGFRRRLERRLSARQGAGPGPVSTSRSGAVQAGLLLTAGALVTTLVGCSSAPPAPSSAGGSPATPPAVTGADSGAQPPASASGSPPSRGRFYLDDGPGDRPLAELQKVPDAVPRAEPLHSRANRPYTIFGRTYVPMTQIEPFRERGMATWYGRRYHGRPTSIGEPYDMYSMTAAHPTLPLPSYARVTNLRTGRSVVVRVNDRGPFLHGRVIDLSYAAAAKLAAALPGSAEVEVELITRFDEVPVAATGLASAAPAASPAAQPVAVASAPVPAGAPAPASAPAPAVSVAPVSSAPQPASTPAANSSQVLAIPVSLPSAPVVVASGAPTVPGALSTSSVPPAASSGLLSPGRYVQLGAYQTQEGAEAALAQLRGRGLPEPVSVRRDGAWHKLVAGPYAQAADALDAQRRLRAATGIDAFVLLRQP